MEARAATAQAQVQAQYQAELDRMNAAHAEQQAAEPTKADIEAEIARQVEARAAIAQAQVQAQYEQQYQTELSYAQTQAAVQVQEAKDQVAAAQAKANEAAAQVLEAQNETIAAQATAGDNIHTQTWQSTYNAAQRQVFAEDEALTQFSNVTPESYSVSEMSLNTGLHDAPEDDRKMPHDPNFQM